MLLLGNGVVELGFSINEQMLKINMKEQTIMYEGVHFKKGGILKVAIIVKMLKTILKVC